MGIKYRIDRLRRISYRGRKKMLNEKFRCRYFAKSQLVRYKCNGSQYDFTNFRGSRFKEICFDNAIFWGCDIWGAVFNNCTFKNAQFIDCVFVACRFRKCNFKDAQFEYTTIVNTNLSECKDINITNGAVIHKQYPKNDISGELKSVLDLLKENRNIRKARLLHLPNNRLNELNIYLLLNKFNPSILPKLLLEMNCRSTVTITSYKKMELVLTKIRDML